MLGLLSRVAITPISAGEAKATMSQALTSPRYSRSLLVGAAAVAGFLCAGTLALWAHYGTTVFYEMILAGMAACL